MPRKTTDRDDRNIKRQFEMDPKTSLRKVAHDVAPSVSHMTIKRRANEFGIVAKRTKKTIMITPVNIKKRLEWCKARKDWTEDDWSRVMFSDESWFFWQYHGAEYVWLREDDTDNPVQKKAQKKHPDKVMFWGAFCIRGVSELYRVEGNMRKEQYIGVITHYVLPAMEKLLGYGGLFQQDNAPPHTAKLIKNYFEELKEFGDLEVMNWPP